MWRKRTSFPATTSRNVFSKLPKVNSFDVFDTLLARRVAHPADIFDIVERSFPFKNYSKWRKQAEGIKGLSFDSIFAEFKNLSDCDDETAIALREFEIRTECENCYLIQSNYALVQDGDILVSDTYMLDTEIRRLLESAGFKKDVTIFSSSSGKSKFSGQMYEHLLKSYIISCHTGDNQVSDIRMARTYGLTTRYTLCSYMNSTEAFFQKREKYGFVQLLREFRLQNPYIEHSYEYTLYEDQASYNIPVLLLLSHLLFFIMQKESLTLLLCFTRDGCLLFEVFQRLFPDTSVKMLQSSRRMHYSANDEYKEYLKQMYIPGETLLFDMNGSFTSGRSLYQEIFGHLPRVHIFTYCGSPEDTFDSLSYCAIAYKDYIERYNSDTVGTLINVENGEFIRRDVEFEYSQKDAIIYRDCVLSFCNFMLEPRFADVLKTEIDPEHIADFYEENKTRKPRILYHIPLERVESDSMRIIRQEEKMKRLEELKKRRMTVFQL